MRKNLGAVSPADLSISSSLAALPNTATKLLRDEHLKANVCIISQGQRVYRESTRAKNKGVRSRHKFFGDCYPLWPHKHSCLPISPTTSFFPFPDACLLEPYYGSLASFICRRALRESEISKNYCTISISWSLSILQNLLNSKVSWTINNSPA